MKCKALWWFLVLLRCLSVSSTATAENCFEVCQRLHAFTISEDTNTTCTSLTYMNTGTVSEPIVATFENLLLPPKSLCGEDSERCNSIISSNADGTIHVVLFPVNLGVALVSFNYFSHDDTFAYRDKYLLPKNIPDCTFVFFIEELIGYCLEVKPPRIHAFRIYIDFSNLTSSSIQQNTFVTSALHDITSLSNFVFFVQHIQDNCFDNEGNHVLFLNGGDIFDHSFFDERISQYSHEQIDTTCSRLHRVGDVCNLAVHCNDSALILDTRVQEHDSIFTETEYGQVFFCPSEDFISFQNETLTLYHPNLMQFGNGVLFPFAEIRQGYCLNVVENFFLVATVDEDRIVLVNFSNTSYRHLGDSNLSVVGPVKIKDQFAIIYNGSQTEVYNLGLACMPRPFVLHQNNFVLASFFTSGTMDRYQCLEQGPAPVTVTASVVTTVAISPSESSFPVSPIPTSRPVNDQVQSSLLIGAIVGVVVAILVLIAVVVVSLVLYYIHKRLKKRMQQSCSSVRYLRTPSSNQEESVKLSDVNRPHDADEKNSTMDSFVSQTTREPLLNSQPVALKEVHALLETPNVDRFNPQPTPETTVNIYDLPHLECSEDVPPIAKQTVYQNHPSCDQIRDNNDSTIGASNPRHGACNELTLEASSDNIPVPCTSPSNSPRHKAVVYSYQENGVLLTPSELPRGGPSSHPISTVTYQENSVPPHSSELSRLEGHSNHVSAEGCTTLNVPPVQCNHCDRGCLLIQGPASNATLDSDDVRKVYQRVDSKMNEQGHRQYVDDIMNGDSQSQSSEPNNDNLSLDRQGSNDSQENEN